MKRALNIIGRFALGGWVLITGTLVVVSLIFVATQVAAQQDFSFEGLFWVLLFSLFGLIGGAIVGLIAAALDCLIKPPAAKAAATVDVADPTVWPPPPKI